MHELKIHWLKKNAGGLDFAYWELHREGSAPAAWAARLFLGLYHNPCVAGAVLQTPSSLIH